VASHPAVAQDGAIQSPVGKAGLALVATEDGYSVEDNAGTRRRIRLPEGTRLSAIRELNDGWVAAGEIFYGDVSDLILIRQRGISQKVIEAPSPDPAIESAAYRLDPEPLVQNGELVGLAWLEGDDREANAVRAARWTGTEWDAIETVAPPVHQAQLALSSAVLDDGSWLLVWAAVVDGDDDILWSRYHGGQWSASGKLHPENDVPDIVPAVAAVDGGALVSWSWFDGSDYRIRVARFDVKRDRPSRASSRSLSERGSCTRAWSREHGSSGGLQRTGQREHEPWPIAMTCHDR
jgi:hypothetical protein